MHILSVQQMFEDVSTNMTNRVIKKWEIKANEV